MRRPFPLGRATFLCRALLCTALTLALAGCDIFGGDEGSELDDRLEAALAEASPDRSAAFFRMPASDDYAAIPQDPRNPLSDAKVALGQLLYHETGLAVNPLHEEGRFSYSCASCHHAAAGFQAGNRQGIGEGGTGFGQRGEARTKHAAYDAADLDVQPVRTPSAMNGAYQRVMLWNGQFGATGPNAGTEASWTADTPKAENHLGYEGLETQAIAGLKVHRMTDIDQSIAATHPTYVQLFAEAFGPSAPIDRERAGLAIAAYERTLLASEAPFQRWLRGERGAMDEREKRGALLFFGKAGCVGCHTGPALNSETFFCLGLPDLEGADVFLHGAPESLGRGGFTGRGNDEFKFKTPQLYNLADAPFYGHGGTFNSIRDVVAYKNRGEPAKAGLPPENLAPGFEPLGLTDAEVDDLVAFLQTALYDPDLERYVPESLPSGNCFPVNDEAARTDLGC